MSRFIKLDSNLQPVEPGAIHAAVHDTQTNLIWLAGYAANGRLEHQEAIDAAKAVTLGGQADWRLPTIQELLSLVDYQRTDPAIDTDAFPGTKSNWHWSSSPVAGHPGYAWLVYFYYGSCYWDYRYNDGFVRAVRGPVPAGQ